MRRKLTNLVALCLILTASIQAQDIHSSHIHATPTFLNPALNGMMNADVRFMANTRSQWQSVTKGYKTNMGSVDMKLFTLSNGDLIGGGLNLYSDKAGDLDFRSTGLGIGLTYLKSLAGRKGGNYVAFGLRGAQLSNGYDPTKIIAFDDEPLAASGGANKIHYFDLSAGVAWFYEVNKTTNFHLGVSAWHLNKPEVSFVNDPEATFEASQFLYRKIVVHGAADFKLTRRANLKPSFIFMDQGPHREITIGTFYKYRTKMDRLLKETSSIYVGGWLRWYAEKDISGVDAIVAAVRFDYKNTHLTFSFDVNISTLKEVSFGSGGPEFSIVQLINFEEKRKPFKVQCPAFSY